MIHVHWQHSTGIMVPDCTRIASRTSAQPQDVTCPRCHEALRKLEAAAFMDVLAKLDDLHHALDAQ
jgi:hypothetical protein